MSSVTSIRDQWETKTTRRGGKLRFRDLSGDHLGVRIEALEPGATSSEHHYHSMEEEHVIVLKGSATLFLGEELYELKKDDHVCFKAGEAVPHHIENTSAEMFEFLVFGERSAGDVVVYPKHQVMLIKNLKGKTMTYRELELPAE